ncbi:MAG TPA: XRE family transcriptional regulator [Candidatus Krumholzibacteria bacterium]|nr:XRE family transcriptional regulator [Candidatus Krumholzibacteria bacterium]
MPTHSFELGERIKKLRLSQNLTLKQLEAKAGVSATHLSEIERGQSSPTVGTLERVARALGEEPALLAGERTPRRVAVVRRNERRAWAAGEARVASLGTPLDGAEMSVVEIELGTGETGFDPGPVANEEFLLVLAGAIDLRVGSTSHALAAGDAIHLATNESRRLHAREAARVLWITLPASTL